MTLRNRDDFLNDFLNECVSWNCCQIFRIFLFLSLFLNQMFAFVPAFFKK